MSHNYSFAFCRHRCSHAPVRLRTKPTAVGCTVDYLSPRHTGTQRWPVLSAGHVAGVSRALQYKRLGTRHTFLYLQFIAGIWASKCPVRAHPPENVDLPWFPPLSMGRDQGRLMDHLLRKSILTRTGFRKRSQIRDLGAKPQGQSPYTS